MLELKGQCWVYILKMTQVSSYGNLWTTRLAPLIMKMTKQCIFRKYHLHRSIIILTLNETLKSFWDILGKLFWNHPQKKKDYQRYQT